MKRARKPHQAKQAEHAEPNAVASWCRRGPETSLERLSQLGDIRQVFSPNIRQAWSPRLRKRASKGGAVDHFGSLARMAESRVEQKTVELAPLIFGIDFLKDATSDAQRAFLLRCYYTPRFCACVLAYACQLWKAPPRFLWEHASHLIAFERTHLEMVICGVGEKDRVAPHWCGHLSQANSSVRLGKFPDPSLDWFAAPREGFAHWEARFKCWKEATIKSLRRYYPESGFEQETKMFAALAGDGLGSGAEFYGLEADFLDYLKRQSPAVLREYKRHLSTPSPAECKNHTVFDTWRHEIQPLCLGFNWTHRDVLRLTNTKFPHHQDDLKVPLTPAQSRSRARTLRLRLSPKASKGGCSSAAERTSIQALLAETVAVQLKSIAELGSDWMLGQRGLCLPQNLFRALPQTRLAWPVAGTRVVKLKPVKRKMRKRGRRSLQG